MKIPVGFSEQEVSERETREAQTALLTNSLNQKQRRLIDAWLSWICRKVL